MAGETPPINLEEARQAQGQADLLCAEIDRFGTLWRNQPLTAFTPLPLMSWEQLERQVIHLSARPEVTETVRHALSGWRARAWTVPPEMLLREILIIASVAMDESFAPAPMREPETEDGEASMP